MFQIISNIQCSALIFYLSNRKRIRLQKVELEGTFGRVFNGTYTKEDGSEESVLVKTVMGM